MSNFIYSVILNSVFLLDSILLFWNNVSLKLMMSYVDSDRIQLPGNSLFVQ